MSNNTPNLEGKRFMCHNLGTIQCDNAPVKIFFKNEDIVTVFPDKKSAGKYAAKNPGEKVVSDSDYKIDLKEILGMQCEDFRITFHHIPEDKVEEYQEDPAETWY